MGLIGFIQTLQTDSPPPPSAEDVLFGDEILLFGNTTITFND